MKKPTAPIKIVFFDIDYTLYIKDEARIPTSITEQVLPRLKAKGIIPAIATGRNYDGFPQALKPLMNENGFELFVTINGQDNFYQGKQISDYRLSVERIQQAVEKLEKLGIAYAFVSRKVLAVSENNEIVWNATSPITKDYIVDPKFYLKGTTVQMLAYYSEERAQEVIDAGILGSDLKAVRWNENAVDILLKDNSKARGIQDIINHFGFSIENAMAFGDGLNDVEMLETVGFGVAMGNAEPELKPLADFVTKDIREDGILYALETLEVI
ncbi:Cof-type HAD-IIB family hydrolase [uncultured Haemophilus sp.]|jgi:Cof subfamily protein (haloacid dehalogenase superfamily)|uniref:Cof-type HAD-IIB family hydrolase n=1 Tax=uncultured Haemophilus sp. TaxID=237779 RepID=UPI00258ABD61|nr:Cof-type HAD-IIB family hydrolase [uncultured Haemophilus sp.]